MQKTTSTPVTPTMDSATSFKDEPSDQKKPITIPSFSSAQQPIFKVKQYERSAQSPSTSIKGKAKRPSLSVNTEKKSIAYYIDLKSPDGSVIKRKGTAKHHARTNTDASQQFTRMPKKIASKLDKNLKQLYGATESKETLKLSNTKHSRNPTYPNSISFVDTFPLRLEAKTVRAKERRQKELSERRMKLQTKHKMNEQSADLANHRNKINTLKIQAKTEFNMASAYLKRQIMIQQQVDKRAQRSERAQGIAILNRLEKRMGLQRSYSANFANIEETVTDEDLEREKQDENDFRQRHAIEAYSYSSEESLDDDSPNVDLLSQMITATTLSPQKTALSPTKTSSNSPTKEDLRIQTKHLSVPTSSLKSPAATSPAAKALKTSLTINQQQKAHLKSPLIPETVKQTLFSPSVHKSIIPNSLKRSQSEPQLVSLQHLINQMHLGLQTGLAVKLLDLLPPITRYTLRELDFTEIANNIQLRHDLVFDPNLQFKPNDEGPKGDKRRQRSKEFWEKVDQDLKLIIDHSKSSKEVKTTKKTVTHYSERPHFLTIPVLINEIKEIMLELIPYSPTFHEEMDEHIDIDLIGQQLETSVINALPLIEYIAKTLKTHCAPIRDELIDKMVETCKKGEFVQTLQMCFEILELMKLVSFKRLYHIGYS
jgi:hypothetical protein